MNANVLCLILVILQQKLYAIDMNTVCTSISGIWSATTNSCFKKYTTMPDEGNKGWMESFHQCAADAPDGTRGRLAHIPSATVWALVRNQGQAWLGGRELENNCNDLEQCWSWFDDPNRQTGCMRGINTYVTDPIKPGDNNQGYLRIQSTELQDTEEARQSDRLCEFVEGKHCVTSFDYCTDCNGANTYAPAGWTKTFCDSVSWMGGDGTVSTGPALDLGGWSSLCTDCIITMYKGVDYDAVEIVLDHNVYGTQTCSPTGCNVDAASMSVTHPSDYCGWNYILLNGVCYMYMAVSNTWEQSFDTCRSNGAVLAGYFDYCTAASVLQYVNTKTSPGNFWISLRGYSGRDYTQIT